MNQNESQANTTIEEDWTGLKLDGSDIPGLTDGGNKYVLHRTHGTTSTEVDIDGNYSEPVFYDWHRNWSEVKGLFELPIVQNALTRCINQLKEDDLTDYWFIKKGKKEKYPFWYHRHRRSGNGEQDEITRELLPVNMRREAICAVAEAKASYFSEKYGDSEKYEITEEDEFEWCESDEHIDITSALDQWYETWLRNGGLDDARLLLGVRFAHEFNLILVKVLAKLLFPGEQQYLRSLSGFEMSCIYHVKRKILFDISWFFADSEITANHTLNCSRD